jgi:Flagellar hook-associated protein 2 C-terminus
MTVQTLARSEQRSYAFAKGAGTLDIGPSTHIAIGADDDGAAVADKVNAASDSPYYAVFVKDPRGDATKDRLVLTRKDTGYFDPAAADALQITGPAWTSTEQFTAGVNAKFTVDGGAALESRSNVVLSAITGLQLTLKATGTTSVTVGAPAPGNTAVQGKIQAFVDQYDSTVDFIASADVNVIALVGERGREVREFVERARRRTSSRSRPTSPARTQLSTRRSPSATRSRATCSSASTSRARSPTPTPASWRSPRPRCRPTRRRRCSTSSRPRRSRRRRRPPPGRSRCRRSACRCNGADALNSRSAGPMTVAHRPVVPRRKPLPAEATTIRGARP